MSKTYGATRQPLGALVARGMRLGSWVFIRVGFHLLVACAGVCSIWFSEGFLRSAITVLSSLQAYTEDMGTDFDERHDEYLILLQQRNR
jgi:hypothetical protein